MGLDQTAYSVAPHPSNTDLYTEQGRTYFADWRKRYDLDIWMEALWREKGGKEDFSYQTVRVTAAALDRLETAVTEETLRDFHHRFRPGDVDDDLLFIRNAREAISRGLEVYYYNNW